MTIPKELQALKRTAFVPTLKDGPGDERGSRFFGAPWLPEGKTWPLCKNCRLTLSLLLQINLSELPTKAFGSEGILQVFYCFNDSPHCEVEAEAFFPRSKSVICRKVSAGEGKLGKGTPPVKKKARQIVGYEEADDYPHFEDALSDEMGLDLDEDFYDEDEIMDLTRTGHKVAGWPCWVQGAERPKCSQCQKSMHVLMQIDSDESLGVQWGDVGIAHLTQCPDHHDELAFGWAC